MTTGLKLTLVRSRILLFPLLQKRKEIPRSPLLKQAHQRAHDRLRLGTRDFTDPSVPVHIAARDNFELEVSDHIGVDEHAREFTGREDELGDEVDGVVAFASEVERGGGRGAAELLVQL